MTEWTSNPYSISMGYWSNMTIDVSVSYPIDDFCGNLTYQMYLSTQACMEE